jgi:serine protease Do
VLASAAVVTASIVVSSGRDKTPANTVPRTPSSTGQKPPAPTGETGSSRRVDSIDAVHTATVRIVAQGSFRQMSDGFGSSSSDGQQFVGSGSGFIVDASGLVVTNNHVVAGAGSLKVYIGDDPTAHSARILGVDECSDLAVIDIEGDGFPYLSWYQGSIAPALEVYAAGYPLGEPEFTLTKGIIAKARASGDTNWASVDHVVEHDANIQPGNSGGPLVTAKGQVVGINYAGNGETNTDQFFAIAADLAKPIVDGLSKGQNGDTVGVNGEAFSDDASDVSGVWVAGVTAGSPAANAGVQAGDIITKLDGQDVGAGGTMADYCSVIRTHGATSPIAIQVVRLDTEEVLKGELNGPPLAPEPSTTSHGGSTATPDPYHTVTDDSGSISVEIPSSWNDIETEPVEIGGDYAPSIAAAPNLDEYHDSWDAPGLEFIATDQISASELDELAANAGDNVGANDDCTSEGSQSFSNDRFSGTLAVWTDCGGMGTELLVVAAIEPSGNHVVLLIVQVTSSSADADAMKHILKSFEYVG